MKRPAPYRRSAYTFMVTEVESLGKACKITLTEADSKFFAFLPRGIKPPKTDTKLSGYYTGNDRAIEIPGYAFAHSRQA